MFVLVQVTGNAPFVWASFGWNIPVLKQVLLVLISMWCSLTQLTQTNAA